MRINIHSRQQSSKESKETNNTKDSERGVRGLEREGEERSGAQK